MVVLVVKIRFESGETQRCARGGCTQGVSVCGHSVISSTRWEGQLLTCAGKGNINILPGIEENRDKRGE